MMKFILIILSLIVMNMSVFGQDDLSKDLIKSFQKYDLVELENKDVIEKANSGQTIEIQAYGREFQFVLAPNDLRSKNYKSVENTGLGKRELARAEVTTYKGKLANDGDSEVRFNVTKENIEGFIYTGVEKFYFVQARKFSEKAQKNDVLIYDGDDLIKTVDLSDDVKTKPEDIEGKMDFGLDIIESNLYDTFKTDETGEAAMAVDLRTIEVATEADYQWVTQSGGATAANNEILGILNLVDGIYRRDLNLTIAVTFQHAWTTPDSYSTASSLALLDSFVAYWNANYPQAQAQYRRDIAHLFTDKFSNQGIAYQGVTCRNSSVAYGLTARSGSVNHLITAHEIGHNLGADHVDNSGSCANSIMNPVVNGSVTGFCETSKTQIANYVATYGTCLTPSVTIAPPTIAKSFSPTSIAQNVGFSTLTISITNPLSNTTALTGVGVVDNFPAGLVINTTPAAANSCSTGTFAPSAGAASLTISGATIPVNTTCNFTVRVRGTTSGTKINTTGNVTSTNGGTGGTATATLTVTNANSFESDVASRPVGDGSILSDDVVQVQRFQIGLEQPNQSGDEFQRADSAPFATRGDGVIQSNDVVQAQRYQIGLDPKQNTAGPTAPTAMASAEQSFAEFVSKNQAAAPREVRVESVSTGAGQQVVVNILLNALGNESGYGFHLKFNQLILTNPSVMIGTVGGSRLCNTSVAGRITCSVNNFSGDNSQSSTADIGEIPAGNNQLLVKMRFTVAANAPAGTTPLTLSDVNASNDAAQALTLITGTPGTVTVAAPTAAQVSFGGRVLTADSRGIRNAKINLIDSNGDTRTTISTASGYYRFENVAAGESCVINVSSKRFSFVQPTRILSSNEDLAGVDFVAHE